MQYAPVAQRIGIGQLQPADGPVRFSWRPYFGLETGHVKDAAGDADLMAQPDYADLYAKVSPQIRAFERIIVTPEVTEFWQRKGDRERHGLAEIGFELVLSQTASGDSRIGIELSLVGGRRSPAFEQERSAVVSLGIKF